MTQGTAKPLTILGGARAERKGGSNNGNAMTFFNEIIPFQRCNWCEVGSVRKKRGISGSSLEEKGILPLWRTVPRLPG